MTPWSCTVLGRRIRDLWEVKCHWKGPSCTTLLMTASLSRSSMFDWHLSGSLIGMDRIMVLLVRRCVPLLLALYSFGTLSDGAISPVVGPSDRSASKSHIRGEQHNVAGPLYSESADDEEVGVVTSLDTRSRGLLPSEASYPYFPNDHLPLELERGSNGMKEDGLLKDQEHRGGHAATSAIVEGQRSGDYREGGVDQQRRVGEAASLFEDDSSKCVIFAAEEGNRSQ